jgi:hypothetical protein
VSSALARPNFLGQEVGDVDVGAQIGLKRPGDTRRRFELGAERLARVTWLAASKSGALGATLYTTTAA